MSREQRRRATTALAVLVAPALLAAAVPAAAATVNVTGSWKSIYHCTAGWCAGQDFADTITLKQAPGSSAVTGTDLDSAVITGRLTGDVLTMHYVLGSYIVDYALTISAAGTAWNGPTHDSSGTSGVDSAALSSATAAGAGATGGPVVPGAGANADFVGVWGTSAGGWRIITESRDGTCAGASDYGYAMSGCKVTGDHYVFTLTTGSYSSRNSGTITGNTVHGSFTDSNGTHQSYVATRSATSGGSGAAGAGSGTASRSSGTDVSSRRDQSSLASSLASPSDAFGSLSHDAAALAIAGAGTLLIVFPSQLFNHTLEENYDEITGILERRLKRWYRALETAAKGLGDHRDHVRVAVVVLVGAYFGALLDPAFGFSWRSIETYLGMVLATVTSVVIGAFVASRYRRYRAKDRAVVLQALPLGLVVAALCMLVSRIAGFEPGYLYGVVAAAGFAEQLTEREEAHIAALGMLASLAAATLSWLLWDLVNKSATHAGADVPLVVLDDVLAAVFVGGLTGAVISLLPLRFLPGGRIAAWHKGAWAAVFTLALFGVVGVLLWPNRDRHSGSAPIVTVVVLFVVFGGGSVAFWRYFEQRKKHKEHALRNDGEPREEPALGQGAEEPAAQAASPAGEPSTLATAGAPPERAAPEPA